MRFEKEIERAIRHQAAVDTKPKKTQEELDIIITNVKKAYTKGKYDFSNSLSFLLKQNGKKRFVKQYEDSYSTESVLCQCIKQIVDRKFKIKYPNRNKTIKSLFGILSAVKQMSDFTIVKFDFNDYFNSVSATYVFEKFIKPQLLDRDEIELVKDFTDKIKYAYAGFSTSNAIAEIIAKHFDASIRKALMSKGILYFDRYVDDSILILNQHVEESTLQAILKQSLQEVFHDSTVKTPIKCKTKFNHSKFKYITRRQLSTTSCSIDYLGYEFQLSSNANNVDLKYGITKAKRKKYNNRIDQLISYFKTSSHKDCGKLELLRHRIFGFTSRTVYLNKRFRSNVWKVKGFISNYGELRYLLDTDLILDDTKTFLKNMIEEAFARAGIVDMPYFLKGAQSKPGYNLFENMKANKTILLVEQIGHDYNSLVKLCAKVDIKNIDRNGKKRGYGTLVREYLIKIKIGY
ncbi:MAG: hypothetical protein ACRC2T_12235 [Thermoguttaceae bacterium]